MIFIVNSPYYLLHTLLQKLIVQNLILLTIIYLKKNKN